MDKFYQSTLQDFKFTSKYDCIWVNWTFCFLDNRDLKKFLNQARVSLRKDKIKYGEYKQGFIFVKENIDIDSRDIIEEQNHILRTKEEYEKIFEEAEFKIVKSMQQRFKGYTSNMCPLMTWVLQPIMRDWKGWGS